MRQNRLLTFTSVAAFLATALTSAIAQQPGTAHSGMMGKPKSSMSGMMRPRMGSGQIVGNKNTKVYHLAGDKGNMPAEKNRVYFRTEAEAMAAGYHLAKVRGRTKTAKPMTHGMGTMKPGMGTMKPGMGTVRPGLPK